MTRFNRLVQLVSAMVLCSGLLMAQQAPRTLSVFMSLLCAVQTLVLLTAVACLLIPRVRAALRRWGRPLSARRSRQGGRPGAAGLSDLRDGRAVLDWRPFEWALLGVLLMWVFLQA